MSCVDVLVLLHTLPLVTKCHFASMSLSKSVSLVEAGLAFGPSVCPTMLQSLFHTITKSGPAQLARGHRLGHLSTVDDTRDVAWLLRGPF